MESAMNLIDTLPDPQAAGLHGWSHAVAEAIGSQVGDGAPQWLHMALHVVLIAAPGGFAAGLLAALIMLVRRALPLRALSSSLSGSQPAEPSVLGFVLGRFHRQQAALVALGLLSLPILYATLELPKRIVNGAIESGHFPVEAFGMSFEQLDLLFALSALYMLALLVNGGVKYLINIRKGALGERLLRSMRLEIYRTWRRMPPGRRETDVIPLSTQEIEPIGGFAGDSLATPVFQGGTLATVILFMFVQDPILGAAAMTLVPVHLAVVPVLQRRVNARMRRRIQLVRELGADLGRQSSGHDAQGDVLRTSATLRSLQQARLEIQRAKYLQKGVSNFLTSMTPFLLYSIGGWLVIDGRLSLGALVAVIAAFKDFSSPFRELLRYYQSWSDVKLRFAEYTSFVGRPGPKRLRRLLPNHVRSIPSTAGALA